MTSSEKGMICWKRGSSMPILRVHTFLCRQNDQKDSKGFKKDQKGKATTEQISGKFDGDYQ